MTLSVGTRWVWWPGAAGLSMSVIPIQEPADRAEGPADNGAMILVKCPFNLATLSCGKFGSKISQM
jgi:hypothetical protein